MTELRLGSPLLVIIVVFGLVTGIVVGLFLAWVVWPIEITNVDVPDLKSSAQEDYIVLTANTYVYDRDLDRARARLNLLKDSSLVAHIARLAGKLAADNQPEAGYVAELAMALGSQDPTLAKIAATATPTFTATPLPTETRTPTRTATSTSTATPTATTSPTFTRTPTLLATRTPRPRPTATATVKPAAPIAGTNWIPGYPGEWPPGVSFQPASAAAGQKFWHLTKALYCDDRDERNDCPNLPGGGTGTSIYVMLLDSGGARASAPLKVVKDDGSLASADDIGSEKSPDDMCNCNYSYLANHWPIQVGGSNPSDTIRGLGLYSVRMKLPQAHTRYFLTFQLLTR